MRGGHHEIARAYVLYRERRTQERAKQGEQDAPVARPRCTCWTAANASRSTSNELKGLIESACDGLGDSITAAPDLAETMRNLYDGVPLDEVYKASILAARTLIEKDPDYTFATARLLLHTIFKEVHRPRSAAGRTRRRPTPTTSRSSSRRASTTNCSTRSCCSSTWPAWAPRSRPSATCSSTTSACRRCTTATSCTCARRASSCRKPSSCAWPWACRSTRSTAKPAPSSSTKCCRPSTSCRARRRCSTAARCARSCRAAT